MVVYYRIEYIRGDLNINRFIILVSIFVLSIILLIISPNLIRILLGWDGLGLVSYCLVIYYQNWKSFNAGIITALRNRIGDVALLMSIAWIINYGRWNYIFYLDFKKLDFSILLIVSLVLLASITKRAQIPFSSWLPAAMAAPTPVSSLVHSSTLVTAGVYLIIRFNFAINSGVMFFLLFISTLTIFMAGLGANYEFDLKKIIALSTLSQLGLIIRILAMGEYKLAMFHLLTHALFKALLFMCAGCIIHNLLNCQDIRFIGGLINFIPLTCRFFLISNMALCGLPFLSGFYSKDLILELVSMNYLNFYIYIIYFFSTGLTVSYTFRLLYYSLLGRNNFFSLYSFSDLGFVILKGIRGLIIFVVFGGRMLSWLIFPSPYFICLPILMKFITLIVVISGAFIGYELSKFSLRYSNKALTFFNSTYFFGSMWNIPFISTFGINYYPIQFGGKLFYNLDHGWSEYFGRQNIFLNIKNNSIFMNFIFRNNIKIFMVLFSLWLIIIFYIFYLSSLSLELNIEDIVVI